MKDATVMCAYAVGTLAASIGVLSLSGSSHTLAAICGGLFAAAVVVIAWVD